MFIGNNLSDRVDRGIDLIPGWEEEKKTWTLPRMLRKNPAFRLVMALAGQAEFHGMIKLPSI